MALESAQENDKKKPKSFLRRMRKKRSKIRKQLENQEYKLKLEDNLPESEASTDLDDLEEFELRGGFSKFAMNLDSDDENSEGNDSESIAKSISEATINSINDLPMKARAAAILQEENEKDETEEPKMGKKKLKQLNRMSTAQLKIMVDRPELVETSDYCSFDPLMLLELKAMRNTVAVPRHWCAKRKYLQGKRGFEKTPFQLPDFIVKTGVIEMRQSVQEKEAEKGLKSKMREKIRPRVGHVDIDYNKLHDAFFKEQTKPVMSIHGDIYYEGKEFEVRLREKKPGQLSDEVRIALGLPTGLNADKYPPPWLIAMQRYGPPPSYPNLRIPGLNAPIPYGCSFGYHANGWGKPPVDESGRPIYGDVFQDGAQIIPPPPPSDDPVMAETAGATGKDGQTKLLWGEMDSDEDDDDDSDNDASDDDDDGDAMDQSDDGDDAGGRASGMPHPPPGIMTPHGLGGMTTETSSLLPGGMFTPGGLVSPATSATPLGAGGTLSRVSSLAPPPPPGIITPQSIELHKKPSEAPGPLFHVLPQIKSDVGEAVVGSTRLYQIPQPQGEAGTSSKKRKPTLATTPSAITPGSIESGSKSGTGHQSVDESEVKPKKHKEFKF